MKPIAMSLCATLLAVSISIYANQQPKALATDPRIRVVSYDPNNVVTLIGSQLVQTTLQFGDDETILGVEGGDSASWIISINKHKPNLLFVKPAVDASDSNLTVITDQHVYQFHVETDPKSNADSANITYSVRFIYPDLIKQQLNDAWQAKEQLKNSVVTEHPVDPLTVNWAYSFSTRCNPDFVPIQVFDDGKFTYFRFAKTSEIPAIFVVDSAGHESLANYRMQGQYVVIERIARQFSLRNGRLVSCIFNHRYPA